MRVSDGHASRRPPSPEYRTAADQPGWSLTSPPPTYITVVFHSAFSVRRRCTRRIRHGEIARSRWSILLSARGKHRAAVAMPRVCAQGRAQQTDVSLRFVTDTFVVRRPTTVAPQRTTSSFFNQRRPSRPLRPSTICPRRRFRSLSSQPVRVYAAFRLFLRLSVGSRIRFRHEIAGPIIDGNFVSGYAHVRTSKRVISNVADLNG